MKGEKQPIKWTPEYIEKIVEMGKFIMFLRTL
jgi:hypothetical protein